MAPKELKLESHKKTQGLLSVMTQTSFKPKASKPLEDIFEKEIV